MAESGHELLSGARVVHGSRVDHCTYRHQQRRRAQDGLEGVERTLIVALLDRQEELERGLTSKAAEVAERCPAQRCWIIPIGWW